MLIDTSGWYCVLVEEDRQHAGARRIYSSAHTRVTHSFIVAELIALCERRHFSRNSTLKFVSAMLTDESVRVVWVDEAVVNAAFALLLDRSDKLWSLCDAVSFVLMDEIGITEALTTDRHFEQAGFVKLLES